MKSTMFRVLSDNNFSISAFVIFILSTEYPPSLATCTNLQNLVKFLLANNANVSSDLGNAWEYFQRVKEMDEDWKKNLH